MLFQAAPVLSNGRNYRRICTASRGTKRQVHLLHLLPPVEGHSNHPVDATASEPAATDAAIIRSEFSVVSLNDQPSFEALSYVWSDPTSDATVKLAGHLMPNTRNIHSALNISVEQEGNLKSGQTRFALINTRTTNNPLRLP